MFAERLKTAATIADVMFGIPVHWASGMHWPLSQIRASFGQKQPGSQALEHTCSGCAHVRTHPG